MILNYVKKIDHIAIKYCNCDGSIPKKWETILNTPSTREVSRVPLYTFFFL